MLAEISNRFAEGFEPATCRKLKHCCKVSNGRIRLLQMTVFEARYGRNTMTVTARVEINPKVMMGKPVIRGTRIPVELILRKLSEGASEADLLDAYPRLTPEDIRAALGYAADTLAHEETLLVNSLESPSRE